MFTGKKVTVGITGGIAAYKAAEIVSWLYQQNAEVQAVMTEAACQMIAPLTIQALCGGKKVATDLFGMDDWSNSHIGVVENADLLLVLPATANSIGKFARGIADDILSSAYLAATCPVQIAPAMNMHMFAHPAVQENLAILRKRGCAIIEPGVGRLACGDVGQGRLADIDCIKEAVKGILLPKQDLWKKKVLITAGPTREPLDPVRYISNYSSGKMGYALAEAAQKRGAQVTLISGPVQLQVPQGVNRIEVVTAAEMAQAALAAFAETDLVIAAAAVADFRVAQIAEQKVKKEKDTGWDLHLVCNTDILATLGSKKNKQILVGFAAESENLLANAQEKMRKKNLDMIVANDILKPGAGFEVDTNIITILQKDGSWQSYDKMSKKAAADLILDAAQKILAEQ